MAGPVLRSAVSFTALHYATYHGRTDCVRELIARGADVNAATNFGETPLMRASINGDVDTVRLLLAAGADKLRVDVFGRTALSEAGMWNVDNAAAIRAILDAAQ